MLTIFTIGLVVVAGVYLLVLALQWAAEKSDPESWALAQDILELQETGKLGNRSASARRANAGGQAEPPKPAPVSPQATFNRRNPPTPGPGLVSLDTLDRNLGLLELDVGQREIDDTALRYLRDLAQYDSSKDWASRIPAKQAAMAQRERDMVKRAETVLDMIRLVP